MVIYSWYKCQNNRERAFRRQGWLTATVEFQTVESACEIILSFGSRMQAVEPAELRQE
ncbi:WYL domain-containing protein [Paenibacillus sp. Soil522]|uniref:WYL domain-containing protein n=1 Tax=Paenibacillus sp. Soil522 TaxID=1736388 RepID=UPI0009D75DD2|nr:WYL domain-containing protein [Paenibacillus sp. Soil522]